MSVYLIIGASSGIGLQLKNQLIKSGHSVIGTYCHHAPEIPENNLHFLNVMDEVLSMEFLPQDLDGLVYCPGSIQLKPFHRIDPGSFIEDYKLNVIGCIKTIQAALHALKRSTHASLVVFSSVAAGMGLHFHSMVSSSKSALEGLTRSLAAELAPAIRVNCIAPSLTDTPLAAALLNHPDKKASNAQRHPLKRIGRVEDMADAAEFLLSEKSGWITGQIIRIDGGMSVLK